MIPFRYFLIGIGYTMEVAHPVNSTVFLLGFGLVISGGIFFIISALKNNQNE